MSRDVVGTAPTSPSRDLPQEALRVIKRVCFHCKRQSNDEDCLFCKGCKTARYCSSQCQASDWAASHKGQCKQLNAERKQIAAEGRETGRPTNNKTLVLDWYAKTSDVSLNVGLLAWKHRNDAGGCIISVETFKHPSLSGAPAGTPHLKAVPQSQLIQRFPDQSVTSYTADFEPDVRYMVHIKLDHAGTETWPAITYTLRYWEEPAVMEFQLLDSECDRAKTFREKVAAESALQEYKLAHVGLVTTLQSADRVIDWVGKLGHRLLQDGRGCFRNITGTLEQQRIKPINNTLGLIRGQDPNVPTRLVVEAADGEIYGVSEANFEFMRMGSRRVTFHGLIGAAHLNGKGGTLVRLKPGSLDRVVVRLDDDGEEVAVKFANYRCVSW